MKPRPLPSRRLRRSLQAGAASLIVVMVLFFLMSLVAAYTSRNLIFEQRIAVNQYRSTQAFEAAEAGLEWAMSMLNSGRIGPDCLESGNTADTSFRQRYLDIHPDTGVVSPRSAPTAGGPLWPSCVSNGAGGWSCSCPADGAPSLSGPSGTVGVFPAFRVRFTADGLTRPGLIRIESNGCTKLEDACLNHPATALGLEGRANVGAIVALSSALPVPPGAALTLFGTAAAGSTMAVYNTVAELGGTTVRAGGDLSPAAWTLRSVPGTPGPASVVRNESALSALASDPARAFASVLGMWPATYRMQQAAIQLTCPTSGCSAALAQAVARNPDRVIWVTAPNGLTLESPGTIGSAPEPGNTSAAGPAMIVVDGPVTFLGSGVRIFGTVHSRSGNWSGPGEIQGAAFVEGDLSSTASATVVMNQAVLKSLQLRSGSFVRAPGGWDDFRRTGP